MKLERTCMDCGKPFIAVVDEDTGRVLIGAYFGKIISPMDKRFYGRWSTHFLPMRERTTMRENTNKFRRFMEGRFWWYSLPEEKCTMPNWKKPFWMLYDLFYNWLRPPKKIETWECPKCLDQDSLLTVEESA